VKDFRKWLVDVRGLNSESARVYASRVSSMMRSLPGDEVTEEVVKDFLDLPEYGPTRSAYRAFRDYLVAVEGTELPEYKASQRKRGAIGVPVTRVPDEVLDAIITLEKAGLSKREVRQCYWGHLVHLPEKNVYELPVFGQAHTWLQLPGDAVDVIRKYAQPKEGMEMCTPLIPANPGSTKPINWRWLKQTLAVRTRNRQMSAIS
jgi:hypothetical protein